MRGYSIASFFVPIEYEYGKLLITSDRANIFSLRGQPPLLAKLGGDLLTTGGGGCKSKFFPSVAPSRPNLRGGFQFLGGAWPPLVPILGGIFIFRGRIPRPAPLARTLPIKHRRPKICVYRRPSTHFLTHTNFNLRLHRAIELSTQ